MANDDLYTANGTWAAIEANGADIEGGTFRITNTKTDLVYLFKSDTLPTDDIGPTILQGRGQSITYNLDEGEYLYARTLGDDVVLGVVQDNTSVSTFVEDGSVETSTLNSTTTPLSASATYTGTGELNNARDVAVIVQADAVGTLYFDFSLDGINWSTFPVNGFKVAANINEFHIAVKLPRYFRVRYVNGDTAQTSLRLTTYYGTFRQGNAPLNQSVGLDADGDAIIWPSTDTFTIMTTAGTFDIEFDDTTDGSGTTGATQLVITYVSDAGVEITVLENLGDTSPQTTSFSGFGINRVAVSASGSSDYNVNEIKITDTTGGTTQAIIPAETSVTEQAIFFVGSNNDAINKNVFVHVSKPSGGGNAKVTIKGFIYNRQVSTRFRVYKLQLNTAVEQTVNVPEPTGFNLSPTDVFYWTADTDTNNVDVSIRFGLNDYERV